MTILLVCCNFLCSPTTCWLYEYIWIYLLICLFVPPRPQCQWGGGGRAETLLWCPQNLTQCLQHTVSSEVIVASMDKWVCLPCTVRCALVSLGWVAWEGQEQLGGHFWWPGERHQDWKWTVTPQGTGGHWVCAGGRSDISGTLFQGNTWILKHVGNCITQEKGHAYWNTFQYVLILFHYWK
jgi:hypothetical protein